MRDNNSPLNTILHFPYFAGLLWYDSLANRGELRLTHHLQMQYNVGVFVLRLQNVKCLGILINLAGVFLCFFFFFFVCDA